MAYLIKDAATDRLIRELAEAKGKPIIEVIREACTSELEREKAKVPLSERLKPLVERIAAMPKLPDADEETHKEFFDRMWDDER